MSNAFSCGWIISLATGITAPMYPPPPTQSLWFLARCKCYKWWCADRHHHLHQPLARVIASTSRRLIGQELRISGELIPDRSCCLSHCCRFGEKGALRGAEERLLGWHTPSQWHTQSQRHSATVRGKHYTSITQDVVTACGQCGLPFVTSYPGQLSQKCWADGCGRFDTDLSPD